MPKKAIIIALCFIMLFEVFVMFNDAEAQAQDRGKKKESFWKNFWEWTKNHTFAFSIATVTLITILSTIMSMVKKDKILKSLTGNLITIELKGSQPDSDGSRYRGRLRVESEGLEVVEEKANQSNEKVSYIIRKDEFTNIHGLIRYHDLLTDREKEAREIEVKKVHYPSVAMRLRRKTRNIINEMKRVVVETFTLLFGKIKERFGQYGKELEATGQQVVGYATEATYDALIDRLIGTRVSARVKDNLEYVGVLKDYSPSFIALLNVDYKNTWQTTLEKGKNFTDHERGLIFRLQGNDLIIQSKSPFPITLKHIFWKEDKPDAERKNVNTKIEPFGQLKINVLPPALNIKVSPFEKLQLPVQYAPVEYKKINIHFEAVRVADLMLLKNYGIVRHRAEKFETKILDFGTLAELMLTSKDERMVMQNNPSPSSLSIYNGYLTNLPKERMDFAAVDVQLNQRWNVMNSFNTLEKKIRPISKHYFMGILPFIKPKRIMALIALINIIQADEKRKKDPLLLWIYFTLCKANSRKRRKTTYKKPMLIKKRKRILGLVPKPVT